MRVYVTPELARSVLELNQQGLAQREIARRVGIGPLTVFRIVHGLWQPVDERDDPHWREKLRAKRCCGCGGMVYQWPCRLCEMRSLNQRQKIVARLAA